MLMENAIIASLSMILCAMNAIRLSVTVV